jgi:hypothetical protein
MSICNWPGCLVPLVYGGRGRPPEYCPEHAAASKQALDKARPGGGRTRKRYDGCCLDAQAAKVRAYGTRTIRYQDWREGPLYEPYTAVVRVGSAHVKSANVRVCAQHQQYRAWYGRSRKRSLAQASERRAERNDPALTEVKTSGRFRLTMGRPDDFIVPTRRAELTPAGAKVGYDAKLEAMAREWLAWAPNGQKRHDVVTIAEPEPLYDIGYWRDKCADGRRWHKTEAFRYSPEMNRGAGWCAK